MNLAMHLKGKHPKNRTIFNLKKSQKIKKIFLKGIKINKVKILPAQTPTLLTPPSASRFAPLARAKRIWERPRWLFTLSIASCKLKGKSLL